MINYIPFLKLKNGEITALKELEDEISLNLVPFFDYAKKENITEADFLSSARRFRRKVEINCSKISSFYLDDFDIDSSFKVNDGTAYEVLINEFQEYNWIPVVGIDRVSERNQSIITAKMNDIIISDALAIRITPEDFVNYDLVEDEIEELLNEQIEYFEYLDLIFDCRLCFSNDSEELSTNISSFIEKFTNSYDVRRIIITGSSIPPSIGSVADVDHETIIERNELNIFNSVSENLDEKHMLILGDYGSVSPNYSVLDIAPELMPRVTVPKIVYPFENLQYISRAHALRTHGYNQFTNLFDELVSKTFYRGNQYSFGDNYIEEKSQGVGSRATPASVVKPLCNAHITFMSNTRGSI